MFNKLALWGTKKEYHTIISLIIATFIPLVGLIFVGNQLRFKSDENGKAHGIFALALILSLLWLAAVIILIAILTSGGF